MRGSALLRWVEPRRQCYHQGEPLRETLRYVRLQIPLHVHRQSRPRVPRRLPNQYRESKL